MFKLFSCGQTTVSLCASLLFHLSYVCPLILETDAFGQSKAASVTAFPANPASGAFLSKNSFNFFGTPITSNDVKIRYVGSDTITKKAESPLGFSDFQPGVVFKSSKRLSLGVGEILPPVGIKRKIQDIPIVVLNSVNLVNLDIDAAVKYGVSIFAGYLVNDRLSVGAGFSTREIMVNAVANTSSGQRLLNGKFRLNNTAFKIGVNFHLPKNRLRLGAATSIFSSNLIGTSIETPLVSGPESGSLNNKTVNSNLIFGDFIFGAEYSANAVAELFADVVWKRSNKSEKEFSLVDLQEKPKDIYDTISLFFAGKRRVQDRQFVIGGFGYEPSPIGPGSKGPSGKSGFGMRETALLYSGFGDLLPAWSLSFGLQYGDDLPTISEETATIENTRSKSGTNSAKKESMKDIWDRTTVSVSFRYRRASLGVDQDGELPGAYSQNRIQFPITIQSNF